jgi:predicted GIY-YIG superfamily endonuclease
MSSKLVVYVVQSAAGTYFSGYNKTLNAAEFVTDPLSAKKFTNKHDVKLRPDEMLVEISTDLSACPVTISMPFRPQRKN